jgi:hypothetical protein
MNYIKLSTLQYPLYEGDIRLEYPEITEDQTGDTFPLPLDFVKVQDTVVPTCDENTQLVCEIAPVLINNIWSKQYMIRDLTQDELDMRENEKKRIDELNAKQNINKSGSTPNAL